MPTAIDRSTLFPGERHQRLWEAIRAMNSRQCSCEDETQCERCQAVYAAVDAEVDGLIAAEREACAKVAVRHSDFSDCEGLGAMDPETGVRECGARDCYCEPKIEHGEQIASLIRARSNRKGNPGYEGDQSQGSAASAGGLQPLGTLHEACRWDVSRSYYRLHRLRRREA